jgi:dihydroorotate dehydrogenase electron transfer subunit
MRKITPQRCIVRANKRLDTAGLYFRLTIDGFRSVRKILPGHFVHVKVAPLMDPLFRRAFSVADYDKPSGTLEIIYKVMGKGTSLLAQTKKGDGLDLIGPLGNSFSLPSRKKTVIMVAGGVGFPPLYFLSKYLIETGHSKDNILFFYGGRSKSDLVDLPRIKRLGVELIPSTDDGTLGFQGFVTAAMEKRLAEIDSRNAVVYGCGPEPMLAALQDLAPRHSLTGQVSLEAPMPCGVGVCLGCVKPTAADPVRYVRVCREGPVFELGEIRL